MMNSKITKKRMNAEAKVQTFQNRLNGETVQVVAGSKTKIIDGVEFMEVLIHGRKNLMRKEHLQPISG